MLNYYNMKPEDFERLCRDVLAIKLNKKLRTFSSGSDGGIDIEDETLQKETVVQVKLYQNSTQDKVVRDLKKEEYAVLTVKEKPDRLVFTSDDANPEFRRNFRYETVIIPDHSCELTCSQTFEVGKYAYTTQEFHTSRKVPYYNFPLHSWKLRDVVGLTLNHEEGNIEEYVYTPEYFLEQMKMSEVVN